MRRFEDVTKLIINAVPGSQGTLLFLRRTRREVYRTAIFSGYDDGYFKAVDEDEGLQQVTTLSLHKM
jgi:hypothetical protein